MTGILTQRRKSAEEESYAKWQRREEAKENLAQMVVGIHGFGAAAIVGFGGRW